MTASASGKGCYLRTSLIQSFGAHPDNHDNTRVLTMIGPYVGEVIVTDSPDEIAEALGLKEQTA